jgi:hypothetical protein
MRLQAQLLRLGEKRKVYMVLLGESEEKKSLGRPRFRENNTKMGLK